MDDGTSPTTTRQRNTSKQASAQQG
eukprot:COSAG01_NODE_54174_length_334_cov_0.527660_1_plen_24_part_10